MRRKLNFSPQAVQARELLNDPKWSWNQFPLKQLNIINLYIGRLISRRLANRINASLFMRNVVRYAEKKVGR